MKQSARITYNQLELKGKTVVITGASSGAGRAAAIEFARYGTKLVLAARNLPALDEVEAECRELGALALAVKTDVTDAEAMKELAAKAVAFGGVIHIWVNNAGVLAAGEFTETPIEIHEKVIKTNLLGYMNGAHAVLPYFKAQQFGVLINNISIGGWFPVPYSVSYSASKFGLRGFSEALRGELLDYPGIHICDLFPAFLDTPGIQHAANYTGTALMPAPPVYDPQEVAKTMVLLATDPKKYVHLGSVAYLLKFAHFLFPTLTRNITAGVVKKYLAKGEPTPETSGNLFTSANFGTSIHGGWNSPADAEIRKKETIRTLVIAGVAIGALIFGGWKLTHRKGGEKS